MRGLILPLAFAAVIAFAIQSAQQRHQQLRQPEHAARAEWPLCQHIRPVHFNRTKLWAVGRDARYLYLEHHADVPVVSWSPAAVQRVEQVWRSVQYPAVCSRALYIHPYKYDVGVMSQVRDYFDTVIISVLTFRRTVVIASDTKHQGISWCPDNRWLECFFEPFSGPECSRAASLRGNPLADIHNITTIADSTPVIELQHGTRAYSALLRDRTVFPHELWGFLLQAGYVRMHSQNGTTINPHLFMSSHPGLYHTLSLSALRSMMAAVVFKPLPRLMAAAHDLQLGILPQTKRCVAVHFRWTDKVQDGGVAASMDYSTAHVRVALDHINQRSGHVYSCLLVLSDDDTEPIKQLASLLGNGYDLIPVSRLRSLFGSDKQYEAYRQQGHKLLLELGRDNPQMAYDYFSTVIVDAIVASTSSDYLIGVGSSGVSQLVAQLMGSSRMCDGNAFAVWQEDVLGL